MIARFRKTGNTFCISLPKLVREALQLRPGDLVIIRLVERRAVISRLDPGRVAPVSTEERDASLSAVRAAEVTSDE